MMASADQSQTASSIIEELASINQASAGLRNDEDARVRAVHLAKALVSDLETPGEVVIRKSMNVGRPRFAQSW